MIMRFVSFLEVPNSYEIKLINDLSCHNMNDHSQSETRWLCCWSERTSVCQGGGFPCFVVGRSKKIKFGQWLLDNVFPSPHITTSVYEQVINSQTCFSTHPETRAVSPTQSLRAPRHKEKLRGTLQQLFNKLDDAHTGTLTLSAAQLAGEAVSERGLPLPFSGAATRSGRSPNANDKIELIEQNRIIRYN